MIQYKSIEDEWREFRDLVVPPNASQIQADETKSAFYSGFFACVVQVRSIMRSPDDEAQNAADAKHVVELLEEAQRWIKSDLARRLERAK